MAYLITVNQEKDGRITTNLNLGQMTYMHFALIVCDIVRHVANAFQVNEDDVWEWVDKERYNPTTDVTGTFLNPN